MVEETKEPERIFPRTMLTGLGIAVIIYMLVAISVVTVLTSEQIADVASRRPGPARGGPRRRARTSRSTRSSRSWPCFAVANTALINMLMASRLLYGLANQDVLPRTLGKVSPNRRAPYAGIIFSTLLALGLIVYVANRAEDDVVVNLSSVDRAAAARRVHGRQRRLPGAAPRRPRAACSGRPGITPASPRSPAPSCRPVGRPGRDHLPDRRRAAGASAWCSGRSPG